MLNDLRFKFYVIMDSLFPILEETLELSQKHQELVRVIELTWALPTTQKILR